ncbi:pentapeptide repeat-containing protein [Cohnella nanjingensis]|uniref:Pentapeptide repeat-containing protein n=1 Tax=Cohnella nanjingensis TaxID=1387779 RepID=A0A7X0VGW8_9BACL|nr:pentapeptide repeat-containing protein [Cohnella nanjingensis]MBB6673540.1 pentapeptide repeat-containing protein [Cohnella nanjingensis]
MNELPKRDPYGLGRREMRQTTEGPVRPDGRDPRVAERVWHRCNLEGADFAGKDLSDGSFYGCNLRNGNFAGAGLTGVHFARTSLRDAIFRDNALDRTHFVFSDLYGVRFDGQTISGAVFEHAGLSGASFEGTTFRHVSFRFGQRHGHLFVRRRKGLVVAQFDPRADQARFDGAFMDWATYAPLRDAGVDLTGVTLLP